MRYENNDMVVAVYRLNFALYSKKYHPEHEITIVDSIEYSATPKSFTRPQYSFNKNNKNN